MSVSKYHTDDRVEVSGKMRKRTSIRFLPSVQETPHGTAVITTNGVYKKEKNGVLTRIDRKPKLGKAARKAEKRAKQLERACKL